MANRGAELPPDEYEPGHDDLPRDEHGRPLSRQRKRKLLRRTTKVAAGLVAGAVLLAGGAVFVLSNTDWGRERVRRQALAQLAKSVHGRVRIGGIRGNLLTGATIDDLVITDSAGQPFVAVPRVSARYSIGGLLGKRLTFTDVELFRPVIVLDRPPDGEWNWKRLFPRDTTPDAPGDTLPAFGDWVRIEDARVVDGRVIVKTPWNPDGELATDAQRDSATRVALAGGSRARVVRAPGGYQKVMDFRRLTGRFPLLRIKDPQHEDMLFRVASLRGILAPFRPPEAQVSDLAGDFHLFDDSLTFASVKAALAGSRVSGSGRYVLDTEELELRMRGAPASFADFRWAYPRLPSTGSGTLGFNMHWVEAPREVQRYELVDADVTVGQSRLVGNLGFSLVSAEPEDSVLFHGTSLRVADFDTRLMEQLIEGFEMPRNGFATGRLKLGGSLNELAIDTDLAFRDPQTGTSRAALVGVMGFDAEGFALARGLRMRLYPAQVALVRAILPDFPMNGTLTGLLTLDGTPERWIASSADVVHVDQGQRSHIVGTAAMGFGAAPGRELASVDADVRVSPLALGPTIGAYAPALALRGATAGTIRLTGPLDALRFTTALRTNDGGALRAVGTVDIASRALGYDLRAGLDVFDASLLTAKAPRTSLSLDLAARGRGTDPETMAADIALGVRASRYDRVAVDSAQLALTVARGILRLDTLRAAGPGIRAAAGGQFGFARGRRGELSYALQVDSLGAFRRWLPTDTGLVVPRPLVAARAVSRARADSAAIVRATEVERAATGQARIVAAAPVDTPRTVRRDSLAGQLWAAGRVVGTLTDFSARGRLAAQGLVYNGSTLSSGRAEYAWTGAPGAKGNLVLGADLDTLRAGGFYFERGELRVAHGLGNRGGRLQLLLRPEEGREYAAHADYRVRTDQREVLLDDLRLRFDTTTWTSAGRSAVRWGTRGVEVDEIDLRNGEAGRVYVDGFIPRQQGAPASLRAVVTDFQVGDLLSLAQSDFDMEGRLSLGGRFEGTLEAPRFSGAVGVLQPVIGGTAVPDLRGTFGYDGTRLAARAEALRGSQVLASAEGRMAMRLGAGAGPLVSRDTPLDATITADSLPLEALPQFTDLVSNVRGRAVGRIVASGTIGTPRLSGALALDLGSFRVVPTGMRATDLQGRIRLTGDSVVIDTLSLYAKGGPMALDGGVGFADLAKPSFDLRLTATNAKVLDNERGEARADIQASMYGPFDRVYVNGLVRVRGGVVYLPEQDDREVLAANDPALFAVADTSLQGTRELLPAQSPFLENLRMSLALKVDRDTWVRSREANVEIFSDDWLRIGVSRGTQSLVLDGVLSTERGEYEFLSKRFQIRRGSATFIGTPELNPTVQATAEYEVAGNGGEAMNIRLLIGGTVRNLRLSLESSAQPPISQSDLLSYLAFGRSSSSLLNVGGGGGLGSGGSSNLAGATGALARNQIAGIALGVAVDELEATASRNGDLDVFNITTAPDVQTELLAGDVNGFAAGTQVEAGKYWGQSRWFGAVTARPFALLNNSVGTAPPGLTLQYRTPLGWRVETSLQPRYLLQTPTLERQQAAATSVFGLFLIKEWRF